MQNFDIDNLLKDVNFNKEMHNRYGHDIYLSDSEINILLRNNIDYRKYVNVKDLIFAIENYLISSTIDDEEIEWVLNNLSEFNYYNNTNK